MVTLCRHPLCPDERMADSGWKTPDMVDIMLKMWSWLPLIHIMKHSSPTLLNAPVAFSTSAWTHRHEGHHRHIGRGRIAGTRCEALTGAR